MTRRRDSTGGRTCAAVLSAAVLVVLLVSQGCSNSILRNAAEAGLETVLDKPVPTPTAGS